MKNLIPQKMKNIYHLCQAILANFIYGFPSKKIKVIGITGTNGKTTVVQMVAKILEEAGRKVAMASTINFKLGEKEWVNETKFTTLSAFQVQRFIKDAVDASCEYLILETSSHSLDQFRVWGIEYNTAVITNVTREHLDYHKNMEEYRRAKLKLFEKVKTVIVNLDMENPEEFLKFDNERRFGYTTKDQSVNIGNQNHIKIIKAEDIKLEIQNTRYKIQNTNFVLHLPGSFNVENALAAICVGISENISLETMSQALEKIKNIPGRFEFVKNDKGLNIIIDYAVTPDSLQKLYELINNIRSNLQNIGLNSRVISVFGSCGDRDRGKRPIMGEIVSENCDYEIVTNEDPYTEDPQRIIDEVCSGIKNKEFGKNCWRILDRREAIKKALQIAKPGDYIVVTGKGAEETMMIGNKMIPWNDKRVILEEIKEI